MTLGFGLNFTFSLFCCTVLAVRSAFVPYLTLNAIKNLLELPIISCPSIMFTRLKVALRQKLVALISNVPSSTLAPLSRGKLLILIELCSSINPTFLHPFGMFLLSRTGSITSVIREGKISLLVLYICSLGFTMCVVGAVVSKCA